MTESEKAQVLEAVAYEKFSSASEWARQKLLNAAEAAAAAKKLARIERREQERRLKERGGEGSQSE